jgi:hypothetical protein
MGGKGAISAKTLLADIAKQDNHIIESAELPNNILSEGWLLQFRYW